MMHPEAHDQDHNVELNPERLSFPLRLLIQILSFAVLGSVFVVRIENKLANVEQRVEQISADIEKKSAKGDAIHTAQGADISNHNVRITVLEQQRQDDRETQRRNENR